MGWLRSLVCFLSRLNAPVEEEKDAVRECAGHGGDCMAPFTRSRSRTSEAKVAVETKLESARERDAKVFEKDRAGGRGSKRQRVKEDIAGTLEECGLCQVSKANDAFVAGCRHQFCRRCIKDHISKFIKEQMQLSNPTFERVAACSRCPNSSCMEELSRRELVELLGNKMVRSYERWLVSVYGGLFGPLTGPGLHKDSRMLCWNTECDQAKPSAVLSTNIKDLPIREVRHAMEIRGLDKKYMKNLCIRTLLCSVAPDKEGSTVFWLCTTCDAAWCAYCGKQMPVVQTKSDRNKTHMQCDGQQKFMMYKCMVELEVSCKIYTQGHQVTSERKASPQRNSKTIWADGTGYGGEYIENKNHAESMQVAAKRKELELDSRVANALNYLTIALNGERGDEVGGARSSLPAGTCALLAWGNTLNCLLRQLATNDSMLDISERSNLYMKMVALLKAVKLHEELESILSGCSQSDSHADQEAWEGSRAVVLKKSTSNVKEENEGLNKDQDSTVIKKMENIYKQAKVMVQRIQTSGTTDGPAQVDISLAKELCACYESLQENVAKGRCSPMGMAPQTPALGVATRSRDKKVEAQEDELRTKQQVAKYKEKLKALQFKEVHMVDETGQYRHHYKDQIAGKTSQSTCIDKRGVHNQKRMLHMAKEVSSLSTTLPLEWESSIHLCVDQHRMDVLRALIIGPNGTPYQNGIFLFDIFLPPDYPQVPPSVHFLTTGGGRVRFNPNLYDSGKICLSLLGTWSGPGWLPGKSTLLQVLVSIQSLIFVQDPYYNEPGFEQRKSPEAEKENMRHREHTLSLAVLAPLRKPDPMFADVIAEHFRHKREEVEQQCDQWLAITTEHFAKQRMTNFVKEIKMELSTLCS